MATLPSIGGDNNAWGIKLNAVLSDHDTSITSLTSGLSDNAAIAQYAKDLANTLNTTVGTKADSSAVYTKTAADVRYIRTINGAAPDGSGNVAVTLPGTSTVTKGDVGLGNADNTSDLSKPISTATQTALNAKQKSIPHFANLAAAQAAVTGGTVADGDMLTYGS